MRALLATAARVIRQLRHDKRSIAMMLALPVVLLGLLSWVLTSRPAVFDNLGPQLLGMFPLVIMFVITAVTMLRERTSGTLERLMASPMPKWALVGGYGIAFGAFAIAQAVLATGSAIWIYGMDVHGNAVWIMVVAVCDALLGTALGLAVSALANSEFQAVQLMPVTLFPQLLLCGIILPRDQLPTALAALARCMPLSYTIDALSDLSPTGPTSGFGPSVAVIVAFVVGCLTVGSLTLRRRT